MVTQKFPFGNLCQGTYLQPQAGMAEGGEFTGFRPRATRGRNEEKAKTLDSRSNRE